MQQENPFNKIIKNITVGEKEYKYFSLPELNDERVGKNIPPFRLSYSPLNFKSI